MEKQNLKNNKSFFEIGILILSIVLCLCSLLPLNMMFIIVGGALSFCALIIIILLRKKFLVKNYFVLSIILCGIALATDIAFFCYVNFMI